MSSKQQPTANLEMVTPAIAEEWLQANHNNRSIRPRKVQVYASEMQSGDWTVTGEGVKFDSNGVMFDGQHRLMAIIKAGVPVWMFVFRNLDPSAAKVVDTGAKRTARDALKWAGYDTHASAMAAIAKVVILWDRGLLRRSGASFAEEVTNTEIVEWVDENHADAMEWVVAADRVYGSAGSGFPTISKATLAAALLLIARVDPDGARGFADDMHALRLPGKGHPLTTLHQRFTTVKVRKESMRPAGQLFCYFRTWNAIADGERLTQLKIGKAGPGDIMVPSPKPRRNTSAVSA